MQVLEVFNVIHVSADFTAELTGVLAVLEHVVMTNIANNPATVKVGLVLLHSVVKCDCCSRAYSCLSFSFVIIPPTPLLANKRGWEGGVTKFGGMGVGYIGLTLSVSVSRYCPDNILLTILTIYEEVLVKRYYFRCTSETVLLQNFL